MSKLSRCTWEETNLLEVDFFLGFKFFTRKVSTTSTVSPPFPWKIQEWSSSGNGNLKTTNQRAEIAFNWLLKVPFVSPPKDAKNSASSAVKFVNQYSGPTHSGYLRLKSYVLGRKCAAALFLSPEYSQNIPKMQLKLIHICDISFDTLSRRLAEFVCIWEILRLFRGIELTVWVK